MQVLDNVELGDFDRAAACVAEGHRLAVETGQPIWDTGSLSLRAVIDGLRGADGALELAAEAEHAAGGRQLTDLLACVQLARGLALMNAGRHADAYAELRRMFDPADTAFHLTERFHAISYLAEAAAHAGQEQDARPIVTALDADAAATPSPTLHQHLRYARAVLAGDDRAEELYLSALRADLIRWPWMRARIELGYGRWLRRQRRPAQARQPLRSAVSTFEIIGATAWAEQARTELRAAGERLAAQQAASPVHGLSAQEQQIARLAAGGLSNREIGERLYLSPRTVGSHLYRIFPKLEITSRSQLASRLDPSAAGIAEPGTG
jgi:DNA-binding CsgD family transcriptional regulator